MNKVLEGIKKVWQTFFLEELYLYEFFLGVFHAAFQVASLVFLFEKYMENSIDLYRFLQLGMLSFAIINIVFGFLVLPYKIYKKKTEINIATTMSNEDIKLFNNGKEVKL